ncbi:NgoPII family restriction endonuclease [Brachyspira innocens]|uniref:NgoPII family restriction endonuclease n=1 Tax=Brachyspira innocens TaxID=13264 RepID=A0ABT8YVW7_9SPIR|nr:NgoPII family restriction endonuclease [Brachyspira innocens]MDO6992494.1 NgoPII family restriction endonuclease [Brachyspira innocens]MDO7019993.1 NgoPII family restriction endonuclease [Brachyspira innocens]
MSTNLVRAIINIVNNPITKLKTYSKGSNRINNVGDSLEEYIKDIFTSTLFENDENVRNLKISEYFSYTGNKNNPPDIILNGGDAIEVKKIENITSDLALNSSYPKSKLYSDSNMITEACRNCENGWKEKDIIYAVGTVDKNNKLLQLSFVYGEDYAASSSIYERIKNTIKNGIIDIENIEFAETNELGKVKRIDPLGITSLRIRGMWHIQNPIKTFSYVYRRNEKAKFNLMAIINENKFNSFDKKDIKELIKISENNNNLSINDINIKDPNNPAKLKKAKIITFYIK